MVKFLTKIAIFLILEFGGMYLFITGIERTAQAWNTPMRDTIMIEPILGAAAIAGGFTFGYIFREKPQIYMRD